MMVIQARPWGQYSWPFGFFSVGLIIVFTLSRQLIMTNKTVNTPKIELDMISDKSIWAVYKEHSLGYLRKTGCLYDFIVISPSVIRGALQNFGDSVCVGSPNIAEFRLATQDDFDDYKVCSKGIL